jgi:mannose-6-phosphate isomerase-like protein (cupin superfamily)
MRYSRASSGGGRGGTRAPCDASPSACRLRHHTARIGDHPRRIYNPVQRDAATFLETSEEAGGARTLAELEVAPGGKVTPHYHLSYSEGFKVLEGRLSVVIDGVRHELGPGDEAVAAPRSLHAWSNPGAERSVAQIELRPGSSGFENSLRVVYGLAADGLVLGNGVPRNPLHAALVLEMGDVRLPGAYAALERVLGLLVRLARRRGVDRELERRYL